MASVLDEELRLVAAAAQEHAGAGEELAGVMPAEGTASTRLFLCAFRDADGFRWLVFDARGAPVYDADLVRETASLIATCELAEENAGGGDVAGLRQRLAELRDAESPDGIEEAHEAAAELERAIEPEPRVARSEYLDAIGEASLSLERALGEIGASPFAGAMQTGMAIVDVLVRDVEERYKGALHSGKEKHGRRIRLPPRG